MQLLSRALCAALVLNGGIALAEEVPIHEAAGFTLTRNDLDPTVEVWVDAQTAQSVTYSLWGFDERYTLATDSSYQPSRGDSTWFQTAYGIDVKEGYRITGITVTGEFRGELFPAQWTMPGDARNEMSFSFGAGTGDWHGSHVEDLHGRQTFALTTGAIAQQDDFWVGFYGASSVWAESVFYYDEVSGEQYWLGSQANAAISGVTMTVNFAPVPEPGTWAMLTVGLAGLALARRRRA